MIANTTNMAVSFMHLSELCPVSEERFLTFLLCAVDVGDDVSHDLSLLLVVDGQAHGQVAI